VKDTEDGLNNAHEGNQLQADRGSVESNKPRCPSQKSSTCYP
jgi:hypothetical protein